MICLCLSLLYSVLKELFKADPVYCYRVFSGLSYNQVLHACRCIGYICTDFGPFPGWFYGQFGNCHSFSPGVRRVIAPPFSERTRALSRFTGVVPKSTLLYVTHVPALLNKVCQPSNVLEGSR